MVNYPAFATGGYRGERGGMNFAPMITISKEDYLKAIATAEAEDEKVISATLANWLSVTRPAVTAALKRLTRDGLARVAKDGRVRLTSAGRVVAQRTIFRHNLIERMLTELFGMPWYAVHEEAERLEHVVSPAFEKKLLEKLGRSDICPHGNGWALKSASERRRNGLCPLHEAQEKQNYVIASVFERDRKLLQFFDEEGIHPGTVVAVQTKHYDGTTTLAIGNRSLRLGAPAARKIWVKKA
jgi:DtxR family transcriptional regulator, Mn-dependent transcriptional regulator